MNPLIMLFFKRIQMKRITLLFLFTCSFCFGIKKEAMNFAPNIESPSEEKKIVVVVPSYNNENYYKGNLDSIFSQKYTNFRVIYTNDASTDDTGKLVQEYVRNLNSPIDFTYIENEKNCGALLSTYSMIHLCENDEIICIVDGDDKLLHDGVLSRLNRAYADDHVWVTYGSYFCHNSPEINKPMSIWVAKEGKHRIYSFRWSHLRTFYAGLFKKVPLSRWQENGEFYKIAGDVPMMLYLLDMARDHVYYIPDLLYEYNAVNPLNDGKKPKNRINEIRRKVWALPPLAPLNSKDDFIG